MLQLKLCFRKHCSPPVLQILTISLSLSQSRLFYVHSSIQIIPFQDWWFVRYNTRDFKNNETIDGTTIDKFNNLSHSQYNACCHGHGVNKTNDIYPAGPHVAGKGRTKKTLV